MSEVVLMCSIVRYVGVEEMANRVISRKIVWNGGLELPLRQRNVILAGEVHL
jgi:hypothetical protein